MNKSGLICLPNEYKVTMAEIPNTKVHYPTKSLTDRETRDLLNYKEPVILRMNKKISQNNSISSKKATLNNFSEDNSPNLRFVNKSQHMLSLTKDIPIKRLSNNKIEYQFLPTIEPGNKKKLENNLFLDQNISLANSRLDKLNNEFINASPVYQSLKNFKKYTSSIFEKQKLKSNALIPQEFQTQANFQNYEQKFDSNVYQLKEITDEVLFELNAKEILLYQNKFQKMADRYAQFNKKYNQLMVNIRSSIQQKNHYQTLESSKEYLDIKDKKNPIADSTQSSNMNPLKIIPTSQQREKQRLKELHVSRYLRPWNKNNYLKTLSQAIYKKQLKEKQFLTERQKEQLIDQPGNLSETINNYNMHLTAYDFKLKKQNRLAAQDREAIPSYLLAHLEKQMHQETES